MEVTDKILVRFPKDETIFITIGTSPSPIQASLRLRGADVRSLPLTNFKYTHERPYTFPDPIGKRLTSDELRTLQHHLAKFLPRLDELSGKTVVLVDYSGTGATISSAAGHIYRFYSELEGRNETTVKIQPLPLVGKQWDETDSLKAIRVPEHLLFAFQERRFRPFSEYPGYDIRKDSPIEPAEKSPQFQMLQEAVRLVDRERH